MPKQVLIVEPYFSGALLAEHFRSRGYDCVAIHLRPVEGKVAASFRPGDFIAEFHHGGDFSALVEALDPFDPVAALPGIEGGVLLADELAEFFDLPRNDSELSLARRDKFIMHERVASEGLRAINQVRVESYEELLPWLEMRASWPIVIKPALSGATDGVRICSSEAEAKNAFMSSIGQINALGVLNETMIAQDFIEGTEFVVDAVTCDGHHEVVNVAYYRKERSASGGPIYREMIFLPPSEWKSHSRIVTYAKGVLDALGVVRGPSHTEIFVDQNGPVLVESGARLCGAMVPRYLEKVSEFSPLDLVVSAYVDAHEFKNAIVQPQRHTAHLRAYFLRSSQNGRIKELPGGHLFSELPTLEDVIWYAMEGAEVVETHDLWSALGLVFLSSPDMSAIDRDVARIRDWEDRQMLVTVEN